MSARRAVGRWLTALINPFWETGQRALDAIATSDPSMTREAQGGCRHGVSGDQAIQRDHAALQSAQFDGYRPVH